MKSEARRRTGAVQSIDQGVWACIGSAARKRSAAMPDARARLSIRVGDAGMDHRYF
jgi:hypothetical protein